MFGQVIDRLDKWLGRTFLLSCFSPWLVFTFVNVVMAYTTFPAAAAYISRYVNGEPADKVIAIIVAVGAIAVAAYITAPLVRGMTEVLEGRYFPSWLASQLTIAHADHLNALEVERDRLLNEREELRALSEAYVGLQDAREVGELGQHNLEPDEIRTAEALIVGLLNKRRRYQLITAAELRVAINALSAALEHNCADAARLKPSANADDLALSRKLGSLHRELVNPDRLIAYAITAATERHALARLERYKLFGKAELAPTRLGNDAATLRSYCETRYNMDFEFLWPRLQIIFQPDQNLSTALVNSKISLDFAVLLMWLTSFFTAGWLVILAYWGESLLSFIMIAGLGPLAARLWLGIVQASYAAFAELVRSAIDLKRFDLLKALHWSLPLTSEVEKLTWEAVGRRLIIGADDDITYRHPAP